MAIRIPTIIGAVSGLSLCVSSHCFAQAQVSVMSLNLHGYHPMGEEPRYFKSAGAVTAAPSNIFFFDWQELIRGNRNRLDLLSEDIRQLAPDILVLQEVGAGLPNETKTCQTFDADTPGDQDGKNVGWRLLDRLRSRGYTGKVACRGNLGWVTNASTFTDRSVGTVSNQFWKKSFGPGDNPYPNGVLIEGFATLVRHPWRFRSHELVNRSINALNGRVFAELSVVEQPADSAHGNPTSQWIVVLNIHGGHKVVHFEQAVVLRQALDEIIARQPDPEGFKGAIVAGDFNAYVYRPTSRPIEADVAAAAWETRKAGEFDYSHPTASAVTDLKRRLQQLNDSTTYKPWASIRDREEARNRIDAVVERFFAWQSRRAPNSVELREILDEARNSANCRPILPNSDCDREMRIDQILASGSLQTQNAFVLYNNSSDFRLDSVSDHPGVYALFHF